MQCRRLSPPESRSCFLQRGALAGPPWGKMGPAASLSRGTVAVALVRGDRLRRVVVIQVPLARVCMQVPLARASICLVHQAAYRTVADALTEYRRGRADHSPRARCHQQPPCRRKGLYHLHAVASIAPAFLNQKRGGPPAPSTHYAFIPPSMRGFRPRSARKGPLL